MFPYLMAGSSRSEKNCSLIFRLFIDKALVYFILATLAWYFGQAIFSNPVVRNIVPGILYIVFAVMLVWYSISKNQSKDCPAKIVNAVNNKKLVPVVSWYCKQSWILSCLAYNTYQRVQLKGLLLRAILLFWLFLSDPLSGFYPCLWQEK